MRSVQRREAERGGPVEEGACLGLFIITPPITRREIWPLRTANLVMV